MKRHTKTQKPNGGGYFESDNLRKILVVACVICASSIEAKANTLGDDSAYLLKDASSSSKKTITTYSYDNTLNTKYKALSLTSTTFGNSNGSNSATKKITLPSSQTVTITAKYNSSLARKENSTGNISGDFANLSGNANGNAISMTDTSTGSIKSNFYGNNGTSNGGAIYFEGKSSAQGIVGDFVNNYIKADDSIGTGGAITLTGVTGSIGNITGDFVGNYVEGNATSGGAIQIAKGYTGSTNITGNFIANHVSATDANGCGGAIDFYGTLGNITGDFIGNYATSASTSETYDAYGGAIFSFGGKVGNITGDFIGNYAKNTGSANATGGAISFRYLLESTGTISGDFIANYVQSNVDAYGGFLYNDGGNVGKITGNYNGNYANATHNAYGGAIANIYQSSGKNTINSISGTFTGNYASGENAAYGGAIYNTAVMNIVNASFYGNHADANSKNAYGGAIYNTNDTAKLTITADNYTSEFIGNYVDRNGTQTNNAIYTTSAITLKAINNGTILLQDKIDGTSGYGLTFTGDKTGKIYLNNTIGTPSVSANNITIDMQNDEYQNFSWKTLNADKTAKFEIDSNFSEGKTDTIKISSAPTTQSYVNISNLGWSDDLTFTSSDLNKKLQILNSPSSALQLALDSSITSKKYKYDQRIDSYDDVKFTVNSDETFYDIEDTYDLYGNIALAQTTTTNDSITFVANSSLDTLVNREKTAHIDTLSTLNSYITNENKTFNVVNDTYDLKSNLGTTYGNLTINNGTINLNNYSGFELTNSSTLNLNDVKLTSNNAIANISSSNSTINLKNAYINGDITANQIYTMNISGDKTTLNGTIQNANTNLNSGELSFYTNTFESSTLNANAGSISFVDSKTNTYNFNTLNSANAKYSIDIDLTNEKSDILNTTNSSSGTILIDTINFYNPDTPSKEFKIQVLTGENTAAKLELANSFNDDEYKIGNTTKITNDVTSDVTFGETYTEYVTNGDLYGQLKLATTQTENDSISLTYYKTVWGETIERELSDPLSGLGQLDTTEEKNFNFTSPDDVYIAQENFGEVSEGTLNINGVDGSTIDGNGKDLFELDNNTELNISDVIITNSNTVITGTNPDVVINIKDSEIIGNKNGITTAGDINIEGNTTIADNGNGIIVTTDDSKINIDGSNGDIVILDKITGTGESDLNIENGNITLGNIIKDVDLNIENANINLPTENIFQGIDATIGNSNINLINDKTSSIILDSLSLTGNINLAVDVDLANSTMDNLFSSTINGNGYTININKMNMLSDTDSIITTIPFANDAIKNNVTTSVKEVSYSPIWKYLVEYQPDNGSFMFTKGGGHSPSSWESFNPATLIGPVAAQLGGYLVQLNSYEEAFRNMDMYMLMTKEQRQAIKYANKYAAADASLVYSPTNTPYTNEAGWFRPYATFEKVGLKNGPKVSNVAWGSYAGLESQMCDLGNGWDGIYSVYASYNGSHQTFKGNSIYQNGANLGLVGMAYKENFFTGLTVNVGSSVGDADTKYGSEDFAMLMTGVASKSGYNYEFKDGRFIIQPNFIMSYTMVNTFDYTSATGVRINANPLHALQLEPGIKFIGNLPNGWQPYAGVSAVMTAMDKTHFKANDVSLPEISVKPYAKYGVGVRKTWGTKFTGFLQAFVTSGGRNGVGLQGGFRWKLGKEPNKTEKIQEKKYIKAGSKPKTIS